MKKNTLIEDRKTIQENVKKIELLYKVDNIDIKDISKKFNIVPHRLSAFISKNEWVRNFNNKKGH